MAGGPSHLETLDYKPKLAEMHGQPMPESYTKGQPIAQLQGAKLTCFAPQHPFVKCGKNGQEIKGVPPHGVAIGGVDWEKLGQAFDADAVVVETEQALSSALGAALKSSRTTIVAARIDPSGYVAQFNALREL